MHPGLWELEEGYVRSRIITLTTDFGLRDPYVAAMKGSILGICPDATLVDVSHEVRPASIREAARMLDYIVKDFPQGTIHVAVVDPGVGGDRRGIAVAARGHFFVGPDNGVFWPQIAADPGSRIFHLNKEAYFKPRVSRTFHGRDIFAPVAAHLALGVDPAELGEGIRDPVAWTPKEPLVEEERIVGEVVREDRFGNLITNVDKGILEKFLRDSEPLILAGGLKVPGLRSCYADVPEGEPLALLGSGGFLEISVNCGKASEMLGRDREGGGFEAEGLEVVITRGTSNLE